jgi:hypothetical protein
VNSATPYDDVSRCKIDDGDALRRLVIAGVPILLQGAADTWRARTLLTWENLKGRHGERLVEVERRSPGGKRYAVALSEYIEYVHVTQDSNPLYLASWHDSELLAELRGAYSVPHIFDTWLHGEGLPELVWLFIGPAKAASRLHVDVLLSSAWHALLHGVKRWTFFPPEHAMGRRLIPAGAMQAPPAAVERAPVTCVQNAGDLVFTPSGWLHEVVNLEPSIALSGNFVNATNAEAVLSYLRCDAGRRDPRTAAVRECLSARLKAAVAA